MSTTRRRRSSNAVCPDFGKAASCLPDPRPANVIELRMRVMPRHVEAMTRWLDAGRPMGLCDAAPYRPEPGEGSAAEYVLVWVRENADPAYMISPEGMHWAVRDAVRDKLLARVRTFEEALHFIRPVLPAAVTVAA